MSGNMNKCTCEPCPECDGSGIVWVSFAGKYLGTSRCDDLDECIDCMYCDGLGTSDCCDYCVDQHELEMLEEAKKL